MSPALLIAERCRGCGKFRSPREFVHDSTVGFCWHCYEWHGKALAALATGTPPSGCQGCGRTYAELEALNARADVSLRFHRKDGIYQVLCVDCSDEYERKRLDLYGSTPYGARKKLMGAK